MQVSSLFCGLNEVVMYKNTCQSHSYISHSTNRIIPLCMQWLLYRNGEYQWSHYYCNMKGSNESNYTTVNITEWNHVHKDLVSWLLTIGELVIDNFAYASNARAHPCWSMAILTPSSPHPIFCPFKADPNSTAAEVYKLEQHDYTGTKVQTQIASNIPWNKIWKQDINMVKAIECL